MAPLDFHQLPGASSAPGNTAMVGADTLDMECEAHLSPRAYPSEKARASTAAVAESFFRPATALCEPCMCFSIGSRGSLLGARSHYQTKPFSCLCGMGGCLLCIVRNCCPRGAPMAAGAKETVVTAAVVTYYLLSSLETLGFCCTGADPGVHCGTSALGEISCFRRRPSDHDDISDRSWPNSGGGECTSPDDICALEGVHLIHLMDVLDEQLSQPAQLLRDHSPKAALDEAACTTDLYVVEHSMLKQLEIQLLDINQADTTWDVISLFYRVDQPIDIVLTPYCMFFVRLLNHMKRTKHMEYVATTAWVQQTIDLKVRNRQDSTEIQCTLHPCPILHSEIILYLPQVQYCIVSDIECAWAELELRLEDTQHLDQVIHAHDDILMALMTEPHLSRSHGIFSPSCVPSSAKCFASKRCSSLRAQASLGMISD
ncbi:hypothetical protein HPB49_017270 [Dermacentor silvarum]|uniref:Uncharacterized protein n=1 Tax=Dermacentor silvarum TaxID=543639 RepID=A0ACB8E1S9_DERSI|nr:hypothetical protein HPB49_017270 [Dermacentor silvarum]